MSVALKLFRRFRQLSLKELIRTVRPSTFDFCLYEVTPEILRATPAVECRLPNVKVDKYSAGQASGIPYIDARLKGTCECYVARVDGQLAHRCFLSWDVRHPAQFGFDPAAPLVIDAYTPPAFRGNRLHPMMRRHIIEDVFRRGLADRVYSEVSASNIASRKSNERSGSRYVARLQGIKCAGMIFRRKVLRAEVHTPNASHPELSAPNAGQPR